MGTTNLVQSFRRIYQTLSYDMTQLSVVMQSLDEITDVISKGARIITIAI